MKILSIIQKNLKLLLRSKTSALIVILGPLLVILLVAASFNTGSLYGIKIGVFANSYSTLTEEVITQMEDDSFLVEKAESEELCKEGIKIGQYHVCAIFPDNMNVNTQGNIRFFVDYSRVNLVYIILESVSDKISTKSGEISEELTNVLLGSITTVESQLSGKETLLSNLIADNGNTKIEMSNIEGNIANINIAYNSANFNYTEKVKDDLKECNASLDNLNVLILEINAVKENLNNAKTAVDASLSSISVVKGKLDTNKNDLSSLQSSISTIQSSLSGIKVRDAENIVSPITTSIEPVTSEKGTHLNHLFPTLLVLVVMFICVLLSSTVVIREKTTSVFFRNSISPTGNATFIIGHYLTNLVIVSLQLTIILAVSSYFFKSEILGVLGWLAIGLLVVCTMFIFLGMLIGYLFRSEETSTLAAISVSAIFLFFSNTVLPIESLPTAIVRIVKYNPFILGETVIRKLIIFKLGIMDVWIDLVIMLGLALAFLILIYASKGFTSEVYRIKRKRENRPKKIKLKK